MHVTLSQCLEQTSFHEIFLLEHCNSHLQDEGPDTPEEGQASARDGNDVEEEEEVDAVDQWHPKNPYQVRMDLPDVLSDALF